MYERTPASVRAQLHRKVGAALERERPAGVPVTTAELATHFERGREPMTALRYYAEVAKAALSTPEDRRALGALVDELPEANDTTAVARVRALVDNAQPA